MSVPPIPVLRQIEFDFIRSGLPRPSKPERLFLAILPDDPFRRQAQCLHDGSAEELGLTGPPVEMNRYHTTLVHISDRKRLRSKDSYAAGLAATAVRMAPFEIVYTKLGSFPGFPRKGRAPRHPLVLLAQDGPVSGLYASLRIGLEAIGFRPPEGFRPHLTLSYNQQFVRMRPIEPLSFVVRDLSLIHSEVGLGRHNVLGRWPLG